MKQNTPKSIQEALEIYQKNAKIEKGKSLQEREKNKLLASQILFDIYCKEIEINESLHNYILNYISCEGSDNIILDHNDFDNSEYYSKCSEILKSNNVNEYNMFDPFDSFSLRYDIKNPLFEGYELVGITIWKSATFDLTAFPCKKYEIIFQKKKEDPWYKFW